MPPVPRRPGGPGGPGRPGGPIPQTWPYPGQEPFAVPTVLTIGDAVQYSNQTAQVPTSATLIGSINSYGVNGVFGIMNEAIDPSFEYDAVGAAPLVAAWKGFANTNSTLNLCLVTNAWAASGKHSCHVKLTHDGTSNLTKGGIVSAQPLPTTFFSGAYIQVAPGETVTVQASWNVLQATTRGLALEFLWYDRNGNFITQSAVSSNTLFPGETGVFTGSYSATAPANAAIVAVEVGAFTAVANEVSEFYVDAIIILVNTPLQTYFDGDTTGYGWVGVPGGSASGQAGSWWWFDYGTTPALGTSTAPTYATPTSIPQTITTVLTGLIPGATYYFAAVGQTAGGLVQAAELSFVYASPFIPANPAATVANTAPSSLTIPHLEYPFQLVFGTPHVQIGSTVTSNDGARVVQQDSDGDILSCVDAVVNCEVGQWQENPVFGIHDEAFQPVDYDPLTGNAIIDPLGLISTIQRWEPRANVSTIAQATVGDTTEGQWTILTEVSGPRGA